MLLAGWVNRLVGRVGVRCGAWAGELGGGGCLRGSWDEAGEATGKAVPAAAEGVPGAFWLAATPAALALCLAPVVAWLLLPMALLLSLLAAATVWREGVEGCEAAVLDTTPATVAAAEGRCAGLAAGDGAWAGMGEAGKESVPLAPWL